MGFSRGIRGLEVDLLWGWCGVTVGLVWGCCRFGLGLGRGPSTLERY